jgi:lysozyme family protein
MQHPFAILAPEYAALLSAMRLDPAREHDLAARAGVVLDLSYFHRDEWTEVTARTGVPRLWGMASFERESGSDYSRSPAQGDRWDKVSVNVPRGLGPYRCWGDACVAAYAIDKLDEVSAANWTWPRACYEGELFNGFGPRAHGRRTGYLWSWTNIYDGGNYVADGKWDPDTQDQQCGMVPMMAALLRLDATLALTDALPAPSPPSPVGGGDERVPQPHDVPNGIARLAAPIGGGGSVAAWVQARLNRLRSSRSLGADPPLVIDGSYGRHTRRAVTAFQAAHGLVPDGLTGPLTLAAIRGQMTEIWSPPSVIRRLSSVI